MYNVQFVYCLVSKELNKTTIGRLNNGIAQIPPKRGSSDLDTFRTTLPVNKHKTEILEAIISNQAILVSGETGSGKTTQVSNKDLICTVR